MYHSNIDKLIFGDLNSVRKIKNHECRLNVRIPDVCYIIHDGVFVFFRRRLRTYVTISARHPHTFLFLHSTYQVEKELRRHLSRYYHTIHPMSMARYHWDCIIAIVYLLCLFVIPIEISIFRHLPMAIVVLKIFLDTFCYIDILLNFLCGYFEKRTQKVILNRRASMKRYACSFFIPDLISSIPFTLMFYIANITQIRYVPVRLLLLFKLVRLRTALTHLQYMIKKSNLYTLVCFLIMFLFTLMYSTALVFYCTVTFIYNRDDLERLDWEELIELLVKIANRFTGFLFSVEKNTVYNTSTIYMYLVIVWIFCGAIFNIMIFSKIIEIYRRYHNVKRTSSSTQEFRQYITYKGLSPGLKLKIERFVKFTQQRSIVKEHRIWQNLSTTLKEEIMLHNCHKFVSKVDFFKGLPTDVMVRIVSKFHMEIFLTNDVIFQAGVTGTSMYFIYFGKVAVYTSSNTEICHLGEGGHFGEIALLINMPRTATVMAISECELYRLSRKDFLEAIEPYPEHKEKIWKLASSRLEKIQKIDPNDDQAKINLETMEDTVLDEDNNDNNDGSKSKK